jgi:MFS family permease
LVGGDLAGIRLVQGIGEYRMRKPVFYGWTVVAAAFVVAIFGWGVGFYGPPIFLKAVQDTRGWPVALVSAAITVHFLIGAIAVANMPKLYRLFGIPRVTVAGAACLAFGVAGWAYALEPWQLFAATVFSGMGWVALGAAGINAMVSPWFNRGRPAALSAAYNGASIGGVIFSPVWVALIGWIGFRLASVSVGIVMVAAIVVLATRVLRHTPESLGLAPDGGDAVDLRAADVPLPHIPVANIWHDRAFQTLALGMALGLFAQIGLITHLFSLLVPAMGAPGAGIAAGLATASAIAGRTLVGWLLPANADRRVVGAMNYGVQIVGCCVLLAAGGSNIPLLVLGVVLFGLGIGNATSMPPLIAQTEFAKTEVVRVVALMTAVSQASYAFAPAMFGMIRDATAPAGSAVVPVLFLTAALFQIAAALTYWTGRNSFRSRVMHAVVRT